MVSYLIYSVFNKIVKHVLILIVVDNGLVHGVDGARTINCNVLILIVVDNGLVLH